MFLQFQYLTLSVSLAICLLLSVCQVICLGGLCPGVLDVVLLAQGVLKGVILTKGVLKDVLLIPWGVFGDQGVFEAGAFFEDSALGKLFLARERLKR